MSRRKKGFTPLEIPSKQKFKWKSLTGFTLVELILVVVLIAIVMAALVPYIRTVHRIWQYGDRRTEILQHGRVSLDKMVKVIRSSQGITDMDLSGQGDYIRVIDQGGSSVIFFHNIPGSKYYIGQTGNIKDIKDNDLVMQTEDNRGNVINSLLAKSLEDITFTYLKKTMDPGAPATSIRDIRAVEIDMSISDPEAELSENLPVASLVYCRALSIGATWVADTSNNQIVKLNSNGTELYRIDGFDSPQSVSVNSTDGSCWVADTGNNQIVKLNSDGTEAIMPISGFNNPRSVSVNSTDGSCWVADTGGGRVVKLNPDGTEAIPPVAGFNSPRSVSVNTTDGSCWVAANTRIRKLNPDGTEAITPIVGFSSPLSVSVNSTDGSCWVADTNSNRIVKLNPNGTQAIPPVGGFNRPQSVSANSNDGSCWVADTNSNRIVKLNPNGTQAIPPVGGFNRPQSVSANSSDGSCWVADTRRNQVVKLNSEGKGLKRISGFRRPAFVSVDIGE